MFESLYHALEQLMCPEAVVDVAAVQAWLQEELSHEYSSLTDLVSQFGVEHDESDETSTDSSPQTVRSDFASGEQIHNRRYCERRFGERRVQAADEAHSQEKIAEHLKLAEADETGSRVERRSSHDRRSGSGRRRRDAGDAADLRIDNSAGGTEKLRSAAVSAMLNSALFRIQPAPLSNSYFLHQGSDAAPAGNSAHNQTHIDS
jgi:hypothetical protein